MQRQIFPLEAPAWPLVALGGGLGLLWALVCIPVGLQWGVSPWSPFWEQLLAGFLCFPLLVGLYGNALASSLGLSLAVFPLILLTGIVAGTLGGALWSYRANA